MMKKLNFQILKHLNTKRKKNEHKEIEDVQQFYDIENTIRETLHKRWTAPHVSPCSYRILAIWLRKLTMI